MGKGVQPGALIGFLGKLRASQHAGRSATGISAIIGCLEIIDENSDPTQQKAPVPLR
jgi:hypothetical protein